MSARPRRMPYDRLVLAAGPASDAYRKRFLFLVLVPEIQIPGQVVVDLRSAPSFFV